ncbi:MAG: LysM peptidoglycan-binding domain-containing protein [Acidobacteria bacterium]|nr:LysM peptidoglycan-binding domain-containing protein [Acidobacteriota bacterium]
MASQILRRSLGCAFTALLLTGCAGNSAQKGVQVQPVAPAPAAGLPVATASLSDPVETLIAQANLYFERGQQQLTLGHLEQARQEFDRALDTLLESADGARSHPRIRAHFDGLVDRISVVEQSALAQGDGFTETRTEPASIDQLLAIESFDTTPPQLATVEAVAADLEANTPDIPIPNNNRVLSWVEAFQGRLREFLEEGLARGAQYLPMIQSVFRAEGLPLDLAYVPLIESAFKPAALSRAKARGVWQFMRGTAIENGLKADWYIDERADPEKATVAAAKYLKTLHGMFDDWHLALASYNGGPGRMQRALRTSRKADFWSLTSTTRYLPRETRNYVPMILAAIIIAKNPAQYGFDVAPHEPTPTETVTLPAAVDLRRVAEWAEVPVDDIQRLNPEFRRWTTPIREGDYELEVPEGTAEKVRAGLAASAPHQLNALQWHTVKAGESLSTIARKLRVSRNDLAEANYLRVNSRVRAGQRLVVPRMPTAALLARAANASEAAAPTVVAVAATSESDEMPATIYRVRPGDTLYAIARRHGTTVDQLKAWNNLKGSALSIGKRLVVQPSRPANAQQ